MTKYNRPARAARPNRPVRRNPAELEFDKDRKKSKAKKAQPTSVTTKIGNWARTAACKLPPAIYALPVNAWTLNRLLAISPRKVASADTKTLELADEVMLTAYLPKSRERFTFFVQLDPDAELDFSSRSGMRLDNNLSLTERFLGIPAGAKLLELNGEPIASLADLDKKAVEPYAGLLWRYRTQLKDLRKTTPERWFRRGGRMVKQDLMSPGRQGSSDQYLFPHVRLNLSVKDRRDLGVGDADVYALLVGKEDGYGDIATSFNQEDFLHEHGVPTLLLKLMTDAVRGSNQTKWGIGLLLTRDEDAAEDPTINDHANNFMKRLEQSLGKLIGLETTQTKEKEFVKVELPITSVQELERRRRIQLSARGADGDERGEAEVDLAALAFEQASAIAKQTVMGSPAALAARKSALSQLNLVETEPFSVSASKIMSALTPLEAKLRAELGADPERLKEGLAKLEAAQQQLIPENAVRLELLTDCMLRFHRNVPQAQLVAPQLVDTTSLLLLRNRYIENILGELICAAFGPIQTAKLRQLAELWHSKFSRPGDINELRWTIVRERRFPDEVIKRITEKMPLPQQSAAQHANENQVLIPEFVKYRYLYPHIQLQIEKSLAEEELPTAIPVKVGDNEYELHGSWGQAVEQLMMIGATHKLEVDEDADTDARYSTITVYAPTDTSTVFGTDPEVLKRLVDADAGLHTASATDARNFAASVNRLINEAQNALSVPHMIKHDEKTDRQERYELSAKAAACPPTSRVGADLGLVPGAQLSNILVVAYSFDPDIDEGEYTREEGSFATFEEASEFVLNFKRDHLKVNDEGRAVLKEIPDLIIGAVVARHDVTAKSWAEDIKLGKGGKVTSDPASSARLFLFNGVNPNGTFNPMQLNDTVTRNLMGYVLHAKVTPFASKDPNGRFEVSFIRQEPPKKVEQAKSNTTAEVKAPEQRVKPQPPLDLFEAIFKGWMSGGGKELTPVINAGVLNNYEFLYTKNSEKEDFQCLETPFPGPAVAEHFQLNKRIPWCGNIWSEAVKRYFVRMFSPSREPAKVSRGREAARIARVTGPGTGTRIAGGGVALKAKQSPRAIIASTGRQVQGWTFALSRMLSDNAFPSLHMPLVSGQEERDVILLAALKHYGITPQAPDGKPSLSELKQLRAFVEQAEIIPEAELDEFRPAPRKVKDQRGVIVDAEDEAVFSRLNPRKQPRYRERRARRNPSTGYSQYFTEKFKESEPGNFPNLTDDDKLDYTVAPEVFPAKASNKDDYGLSKYGERLAAKGGLVRFAARPTVESNFPDPSWSAQAGLSLDEAKSIAKRQGQARGTRSQSAIPASSALCAANRRPKLPGYLLPVALKLAGRPGFEDRKVVLWVSPEGSTPRIMMIRRNVHIDCDFVAMPGGRSRGQMLALAMQDVLLWLAEKPRRAIDTYVYIGQVGDSTLRLAWKPGSPVTFDNMLSTLGSDAEGLNVDLTGFGYSPEDDKLNYEAAARRAREQRLEQAARPAAPAAPPPARSPVQETAEPESRAPVPDRDVEAPPPVVAPPVVETAPVPSPTTATVTSDSPAPNYEKMTNAELLSLAPDQGSRIRSMNENRVQAALEKTANDLETAPSEPALLARMELLKRRLAALQERDAAQSGN